jgi:hypothetical protein
MTLTYPAHRSVAQRFRLSHQQEGLAAMMARVDGRHGYWMTQAVQLHHPVDLGQLRDALALTAERHPVLNSRFTDDLAGPLPEVGPGALVVELTSPVDHHQLHPGSGELEGFFAAAAAGDVLAGDAPCQLATQAEPQGVIVAAAVHHLVFDGWSWHLFLHDLAAAYQHLSHDRPLPPAPAVAYVDYARWQHDTLTGSRYQAHLKYWRALAAGYPVEGLALTSRSGPRPTAGPAATVAFSIPPALAVAVNDLAARHHVSLFVAALAVFNATLAAHTRTGDVLVGVTTANRRTVEHRDVVGFFANGRYLRTTLDPRASVDDLVDQVTEAWTTGHAHQDLHLERTVVHLGLPDLVNIKFGIDDTSARVPAPDFGPGITHRHRSAMTTHSARRDLSVTLTPAASGGYHGHAVYRLDALNGPAAERLIAAYLANLAQAGSDPAVCLDQLAPCQGTG